MGNPLADPGEEGSGYDDVRDILHSGCSYKVVILVRDLDGDPPHGA